jgi:hypothetical protein
MKRLVFTTYTMFDIFSFKIKIDTSQPPNFFCQEFFFIANTILC